MTNENQKVILRIPVFSQYSGELLVIEKIINVNHIDCILNLKLFNNKDPFEFKIKKQSYIEENNTIYAVGHLKGVYGFLNSIKCPSFERGLNLWALEMSVDDFIKRSKDLEYNGFNVYIDEYAYSYIKQENHELKRTKVQKFFGLNKYRKD